MPPRTYGAIRSITLMPVSKISVVGDRSSKAGGSRWIAQRSVPSGARRLVVHRIAEHVPDAPERLLADRNGDRLSGVDDVDAAREAVGRVHRDGADAVVAEMLLHLRDQDARLVASRGAAMSMLEGRCRCAAGGP